MTRLLGLTPSPPKASDLRLANYLDRPKLIEAIQAPRLLDWAAVPLPSGSRPMPDRDPLANDRKSCCTFSAGGHWANLVAQHALLPLRVTDEQVEADYLRITGGDNGASIRDDLLRTWLHDGLWDTKLLAYASVDYTDPEEMALASFLGIGLLGGYALPLVSQDQVDERGRPQWTMPAGGWPEGKGPGSWGLHAIYTHGERSGNTWGEDVVTDMPWHGGCCFELWFGLLDIARIGDRGINGFDWQQLVADAEARAAL